MIVGFEHGGRPQLRQLVESIFWDCDDDETEWSHFQVDVSVCRFVSMFY